MFYACSIPRNSNNEKTKSKKKKAREDTIYLNKVTKKFPAKKN